MTPVLLSAVLIAPMLITLIMIAPMLIMPVLVSTPPVIRSETVVPDHFPPAHGCLCETPREDRAAVPASFRRGFGCA